MSKVVTVYMYRGHVDTLGAAWAATRRACPLPIWHRQESHRQTVKHRPQRLAVDDVPPVSAVQALTRVPNVASWTQCRAFSLTRPVSLARFIREADSLSQMVQAFKRPFGGVVKPETIVRPKPRVRLPDSRPAVEAKTHLVVRALYARGEKRASPTRESAGDHEARRGVQGSSASAGVTPRVAPSGNGRE
jgi:hypothetical protein